METYEKAMAVLPNLFGKDYTFVIATSKDNVPSTRVVDTYYENGEFWIVTYGTSKKCTEIASNPNVSLCNTFNGFSGKAYNMGHPLKNPEIRETLIKVFEPWYFAHNNEADENMCFVKFKPEAGFFHKDGVGYKVDFVKQEATAIPFSPDIEMIN